MPKLIDADKLKQHYAWWDNEDKKIFDTIIDLQPDAVRHGRWINDFSSPLKCSSCGIESKANEITLRTDFKFCPYCGAKMDEVEDAEIH